MNSLKKVLLLAVLLSGCTTQAQPPAMTPVKPIYDIGNPEAIVCKTDSDAGEFVRLAGNNQRAEFKQFLIEASQAQRCKVLNSAAPVTITHYQPIPTDNGTLFIVEFRQGADTYFTSPNYFERAGEASLIWEEQLTQETR